MRRRLLRGRNPTTGMLRRTSVHGLGGPDVGRPLLVSVGACARPCKRVRFTGAGAAGVTVVAMTIIARYRRDVIRGPDSAEQDGPRARVA